MAVSKMGRPPGPDHSVGLLQTHAQPCWLGRTTGDVQVSYSKAALVPGPPWALL